MLHDGIAKPLGSKRAVLMVHVQHWSAMCFHAEPGQPSSNTKAKLVKERTLPESRVSDNDSDAARRQKPLNYNWSLAFFNTQRVERIRRVNSESSKLSGCAGRDLRPFVRCCLIRGRAGVLCRR